ncbi:MAG: ADP-ribosylglycohydrolase family protein [Syntrophomonadaceae bacterium]|nr:ADP-ribosylglycohydrolase family protein [Syntrophomonadaceae bacterium]
MQLYDRARGVMTGLALGDALGVIAEGLSAEQIKSTFGFIKDFSAASIIDTMMQTADDERSLNALQRFIARLPLPGLYSDDTQQALIIADCLIKHGNIDTGYLASAYLEMASCPRQGSFGLFRNVGPGFVTTVNNLRKFKPYSECGAISAGNGSAMRISPLGVYFYHDYDLLKQAIIDASLLTHQDIRGIAAAGVIAFTIAYSITHDPQHIDFSNLSEELFLFVRSLEEHLSLEYPSIVWEDFTVNQVSKSIELLREVLDYNYDEAINRLDVWAAAMSNNPQCKHNHSFALGSVIFSLYLFIKQGSDPVKAILAAVNGGGDTDTIAAMTGALCGALHGSSAFPQSWHDNLINREQISLRGRALADMDFDLNLLEDLFEMEKAACKAEDLYRNKYRQALRQKFGI